ncbi:MAG: SDR family NAD(P)-dependent oxidoreductase [Hyphomicrobiales bacterium]
MKTLENKNAVITGGSDGIGYAIAKAFAENGANILLIARNTEKLEKAKQELEHYGSNIHILPADLSKIETLKQTSESILQAFPRIDILVNNAGIGRFIPFEEMNEEALDLHLNLNIKAMYLLTHYLYESIKDTKGNIINISSYFSHRMLPGRTTTAYSMTKGGVDSFTKALAFEAGKYDVRVNAIAPGSVATEQLLHNYNQLSDKGKQQFDEMIKTIYPLGKIGNTEDIAEMTLFLASPKAKWITGTIMNIDGGLTTN